jgi:hypothetical protein
MANKGLLFEWSIYHLVNSKNVSKYLRDPNSTTAKNNYESADKEVKTNAQKAIGYITAKYGAPISVEKTSGGGKEPKTDLYFICPKGKPKCSLKYGGSIQLSSGGIKNTVAFLSDVLKSLCKMPGYDVKKLKQIISILSEFEEKFGNIGSVPRRQADEVMSKTEGYDEMLKNILGSRTKPKVSDEFDKIKLAIVEEAMTGRFTFASSPKLSADHILSEKDLRKITPSLIREVADKTSVRIALKGRGKKEIAGKEVRLNEVVVRFDTKA